MTSRLSPGARFLKTEVSPTNVGKGTRQAKSHHSPVPSRLDRLLDLVTEHESAQRKQDIKVSDLNRRITALEVKVSSELHNLAIFQDRDFGRELDMARLAMEGLVKQLLALTRTVQEVKAQQQDAVQALNAWRVLAEKLEQRQGTSETQVELLQQEVVGMRKQLVEVSTLHQEVSSVRRQLSQVSSLKPDLLALKQQEEAMGTQLSLHQGSLDALRRELGALERRQSQAEEQLEERLDQQVGELRGALTSAIDHRAQALSAEVMQEVAAARKDFVVHGGSSSAALERRTQAEVSSLSSQLRSCQSKLRDLEVSTSQQHSASRRDADAATQELEAVGQELRRVKKHVIKWQNKFGELQEHSQRLSSETEAMLAPLYNQLMEMRAALVQLTAHLQQAASEASVSVQQAEQAHSYVGLLADAVGLCLHRCTEASRTSTSTPSTAASFLPPSLRPMPFSHHPLGNAAMEAAVADFNTFVQKLKAQLGQHNDSRQSHLQGITVS